MSHPLRVIASLGWLAIVAGCAVSGVGGSSEFSCAAGKGVPCGSITGNTQNYEAGNLPYQRPTTNDAPSPARPAAGDRRSLNYREPKDLPTAEAARADTPGVSPAVMSAPSTGVPMRTPERILRVWLAPTETADGTFEDQRYVYVTVSQGRWLIDMNRASLQDKYRAIRNVSPAAAQMAPPPPPKSASEQARELARQPELAGQVRPQ